MCVCRTRAPSYMMVTVLPSNRWSVCGVAGTMLLLIGRGCAMQNACLTPSWIARGLLGSADTAAWIRYSQLAWVACGSARLRSARLAQMPGRFGSERHNLPQLGSERVGAGSLRVMAVRGPGMHGHMCNSAQHLTKHWVFCEQSAQHS